MSTFDPTRSYRPDLDVRDWSDWTERLTHDRPNGALWAIVAPRRSGKTWALTALQQRIPGSELIDLRRTTPATTNASHLLLDEPGAVLEHDAAAFIEECSRKNAKILIAATPREWSLLIAAGANIGRIQDRDRRCLPALTAAQAEKLASRAPIGAALLPELPASWKRNPFLLELILSIAEANPTLSSDISELARTAIAVARAQHDYPRSVFDDGLDEPHRRALRKASGRSVEGDPSATRLLEACGLLEQDRIVDPVIADHLPEPIRIHHLSDLHFGEKEARLGPARSSGAHVEHLEHAIHERTVRDAYLSHLKISKDKGTAPHLLIISGDIVEFGQTREYPPAIEWITAASALLADHPDLKTTPARVLVVGGNHDVSWADVSAAIGDRRRHQPFAEAFAAFPHPRLELEPEARRLAIVAYPHAGLEIVLLGSAEVGGELHDDEDKQMLFELVERAEKAFAAGELDRYRTLRKKLDRIDPGLVHRLDLDRLAAHHSRMPVKIAVLHHPVSPLPVMPDVERFAGLLNAGAVKDALLRAGITLVLHGHQHSAWIAREQWPNRHEERTLTIMSAPTLGSRETGEKQGFNEICLFREGSVTYTLEARCVKLDGRSWTAGDPVTVQP